MVAVAVEIVSKGSERTDRWLKPVEYAEAGIARFWRVEPDDTVIQFRLDGNRYTEYGRVALEDLLAGEVPDLPGDRECGGPTEQHAGLPADLVGVDRESQSGQPPG
jgi:putative restriction endonuclease